MTIKKLVVREFVVDENTPAPSIGFKYSYFYDPETDKYYRPLSTFVITGDVLEEAFEEVIGE